MDSNTVHKHRIAPQIHWNASRTLNLPYFARNGQNPQNPGIPPISPIGPYWALRALASVRRCPRRACFKGREDTPQDSLTTNVICTPRWPRTPLRALKVPNSIVVNIPGRNSRICITFGGFRLVLAGKISRKGVFGGRGPPWAPVSYTHLTLPTKA